MTKKLKILLLCDHPLATSGVGVQARFLINGLIATGKYSFLVFGAAVRHDNMDIVTVSPDFVIKPTNGFGDANMLRQVLVTEKPDALMLFTDPRFFIFVWQAEEEIHQICPIVYNHLWDQGPTPKFNQVLYESTDLINCINYPTYEMVRELLPHRHHDINYIPHAVPPELYFKLPVATVAQARRSLLGPQRADHYVALYVSRNARRKMPSDILASWKMFLEQLQQKHGHKNATILLHTDPLDPEGPNLHHVIEMLGIGEHVVFSKDRIGFPEMNLLYNCCDVLVNRSSNEGFGLGLLEAKMAEKPIIALKTGGMTRQVQDHVTGFQFGIAIDPEVQSIVGNQMVPYILEDFCSHPTLANAFMEVYEWGPEKRAEVGYMARQHALVNYDIKRMVSEWDRTLTDTIDRWKKGELANNQRWESIEL